MRIIAVGDLHLASRQIESRKDSYPDTCKAKLLFVLKQAIKRGADVIAFTGDIFHDKSESDISTALVHTLYNFMDHCKSRGIKVVAVPGNHDMLFHIQDVSKRNLGLIQRAYPDTFYLVNLTPIVVNGTLFTGSAFTFHGDEGPIEQRVQYFPQRPQIEGYNFWVHITHGSLIPFESAGDFQFMDITVTQDMLAAKPLYDLNINGHIHWVGEDCQLIKVGNKYSLNPGSLTRGSLKMENLKRTVNACQIDIEDGNPTFEFFTIPHQPAEVIFDVNEYLEGKKKDKEIAAFVDMLRETTLSEESSNNNIEKLIQQADVDQDTKDKAKEYLEKIS